MTKQQIKNLVAAKIAGQGTQVDAAGVLPTIIDALVDLVPDAGSFDALLFGSSDGINVTQSAEQLAHNTPILDKIKAGTLTEYLVDINITGIGHFIGFGNSVLNDPQFTILNQAVGEGKILNAKIILDYTAYTIDNAEIVTRTISIALNDTDDEIPTSKAVKTALKKLTETPFEISNQGTTEGSTTTYEVTTAQSVIDAFVFAAQTAPMEALPVVNDNGAIIRFVKIEVAEGTVTGHCRIDGGTYALHLINTDFGGNSYFSHTTDA